MVSFSTEIVSKNASQDDKNEMVKLLAESFFEREPMTKHLGGTNSEQVYADITNLIVWMVNEMLPHELSVMVKHEGKLVGIMLSEPNDPPIIEPLPELPSFGPIMLVLDKLSDIFKEAKLNNKIQNNKTLHVSMVAVDKNFTKHKLSVLMLQRTLELAKQNGYQDVVIKATSESQILLERVGCVSLGEVVYSDLEFDNYKPFQNMTSLIKSAKCMYKKLVE